MIGIGILVADILAMGVETAFKGTINEAVKDAYRALKEKIAGKSPAEVASLEHMPSSRSRREVIAEIVDAEPANDQEDLRILAYNLAQRLKEFADPIGLDVRSLEAAELKLGNINVSEGLGARIVDTKISGSVRIEDISIGRSLGKM
jgi:hypothetical protein